MKLSLSENIRSYRKKMSLTQEQLAEAMGVSVATVSKWESGSISPDAGMLAELADFFQISVDVLLGYRWEKRSMGQCAEYIHRLCNERKYEEGAAEARKVVKKYPNSFPVVYESAKMLFVAALNRVNHSAEKVIEEVTADLEYVLKLFEHSLELFEQNTEKRISREEIHQNIGTIYGYLGKRKEAIAYLEEHNACNVNDRMIGILLSELGEFDRAWEYESKTFRKALLDLWTGYNGVYNVLINTGRYEELLAVSEWIKKFLFSASDKDSSYFERVAAVIDIMTATVYAYKAVSENREYDREVRTYLREALLEARHFDENPDY